MVKNYINQKIDGDNTIKFITYCDFKLLIQLIRYWEENNEKEILDRINYINEEIEGDFEDNNSIKLNNINFILLKDGNNLEKLLKNVEKFNQIKIEGKQDNNEFLEKKIASIVWKKNIEEKDLVKIAQIKSLKWIIVDVDDITSIRNMGKNYNFKFIPMKYFINPD